MQEDESEPSRVLHPLLARRWSPTAFDPSHVLPLAEVDLLVEAARWAPSAGNSQPWAFVVGRRGDATHQRMQRHLAASSARWAPAASLLVANMCHLRVEDTDWQYSEFSHYDLGQAVAHMTLQAQAQGLSVRQFRAFDRAGLTAEFAVPQHWEVTTMSAIGILPSAPGIEGTGEAPPRSRQELGEIVWSTTASSPASRQE